MIKQKGSRILIFTGEGKGKTTAALGMALRAAGYDKKIAILQFIKNSPSGEDQALKKFSQVEIVQGGLGFVPDPDQPEFTAHRAAAVKLLKLAREFTYWEMLILDEVCQAVALGLLDESDVLELIAKVSPDTVVVLTGRNATQGLIDCADTVTEMKKIKHGFDIGIMAQKGVEE